MSYTPTQDDIALLRQRTKELYTRINLLNKEFKTIDSLEGVVTDGSYTVSSNSDIRRTFTCNAVMDPKSNISAYNVYDWLNKYLRIFVGIKDIRTKGKLVKCTILQFNIRTIKLLRWKRCKAVGSFI